MNQPPHRYNRNKRPVPQRLIDLDDKTILWLDHLDEAHREALMWVGQLDREQRDRLDKFLGLDKEQFDAAFSVVRLWTRLSWLSSTSVWIILTVAGLLLTVTQIMDRWKWPPRP